MKSVKAICTAAIVALALSVPAYAGEISSPGCSSPIPDAPPAIASPAPGDVQAPAVTSTTAGEMGTPGFAEFLSALIWLL